MKDGLFRKCLVLAIVLLFFVSAFSVANADVRKMVSSCEDKDTDSLQSEYKQRTAVKDFGYW